MNFPSPQHFLVAIFSLFILSAPRTSLALDLIVEHNPTDTTHFTTIQAAIDYASAQLTGPLASNATFRVVVKADPAPYYGAFSPISNVPIIGSETGGTFLEHLSLGPVISINSVSNVTIKNFTICSGIAVTFSKSVTIANNIIKMKYGGSALLIQGSPTATIVNNTFYQNNIALTTDSDALITNNIFADNSTAIFAKANLSRLTYNVYHNNAFNAYLNNPDNGAIILDVHSLPNSIATNSDPLFVDPRYFDFHLQSGSPCHMYGGGNAGNPGYPNGDNPSFSDMGAYGGPDSDTIPFKVSGLTATTGAAANSIVLNWNAKKSYQVNGYKVYYGTTSGDRNGTGAAEGNSPVMVLREVNNATLSNLPLTEPATPPAVTGVTVSPFPRKLSVSWTPMAQATGYRVYYSTTPFAAESLPATLVEVNGANTSSASVLGLTNEVTYFVAVSAIAQPAYFLTVTALNASGATGVANESNFAQEVIQYLEPTQVSALSNVATATTTKDNSQDNSQGFFFGGSDGSGFAPNFRACFIATAAYGHYSAPQVQVLRDFRDRYLMTNAPGRAFVAWYYRYGPCWADFINAHPRYKPLVRLLLLPLIGGAMFMLHTSLPAKCVVMVAFLLVSGVVGRRKRGVAVWTGPSN